MGYYRAKKFPLMLENKNEVIYRGSKILHMYLETEWEKESWCKALRIASCDDNRKLDWFAKIQREFQSYLTNLRDGYPAFRNPAEGLCAETTDREPDHKPVASKVRPFFKKFVKKASRTGIEYKENCSSSGHEEKTTAENCSPTAGPSKKASPERLSKSLGELFQPSPGHQNHSSFGSDADFDVTRPIDEGTLCLNLLASRLFFDAKGNRDIKRSLQARIQVSFQLHLSY